MNANWKIRSTLGVDSNELTNRKIPIFAEDSWRSSNALGVGQGIHPLSSLSSRMHREALKPRVGAGDSYHHAYAEMDAKRQWESIVPTLQSGQWKSTKSKVNKMLTNNKRVLEQFEDEDVKALSSITISKPLKTTPYTQKDIAGGVPCAGLVAEANFSLVSFPAHDENSWSEMEADECIWQKSRYDTSWNKFHGDFNLHLGQGNVMCYRWITSRSSISKHMDRMSGAAAGDEFPRRTFKLQTGSAEEFLLIVLPDFFMTLDSMQSCLGQLLGRNHLGRMLLVGSVGVPGTKWREGEMLDARAHARGLAKLLSELLRRGELCCEPQERVAFVGFGCGANAVLQFTSMELAGTNLLPVRRATQFLTLVNPFPPTPNDSEEFPLAKSSVSTLRRILGRSDHHQQLHSIVESLFSADYISKHGRIGVLKKFWLGRRSIVMPQTLRPETAPITRRQGRQNPRRGSRHDRCVAPKGQAGIMKLLEGIIEGNTMGPLCHDIEYPIIQINSTQDSLNSMPKHILWSVNGHEVKSMFELINGYKPRRIFVYNVPSGREILQEAPSEIVGIISDALRAVHNRLSISEVERECFSDKEWATCRTQGDTSHVVESSAANVMHAGEMDDSWKNIDTVIGSISFEDHSDGIKPFSEENDSTSSNNQDVGHPKHLDMTSSQRRQQGLSHEARGETFLDHVRGRLNPLNKDTEIRNIRRISQTEQLKGDPFPIAHLGREHDRMKREEYIARKAECHHRKIERWKLSVVDAKTRALELSLSRDAYERKLAADRIGYQRVEDYIQRHRQRNLQVHSQPDDEQVKSNTYVLRVKRMAVEEVQNIWDSNSEYLLSLQRKYIVAMDLESVRREQLEAFDTHYREVEMELRTMERLVCPYKRGEGVIRLSGAFVHDAEGIEKKVVNKRVQLASFRLILKERQEIWQTAISRLKRLKVCMRSEKAKLWKIEQEISQHIRRLGYRLKRQRTKNREMIPLSRLIDFKLQALRVRVARMEHELLLLRAHEEQTLFDTDMMHSGVVQRIGVKKLTAFLKAEVQEASAIIQGYEQQMERITSKLDNHIKLDYELNERVQCLTRIVQDVRESLEKSVSLSLNTETQKPLASPEENLVKQSSSIGEERNMAQQIRRKPSCYRNREEKRWIALDILVNMDAYDRMTNEERDEILLDDEYRTVLTKADVQRIMDMPHEVNLSLPHLKSMVEVEAHGLVHLYSHELGDVHFAELDSRSQDCLASPRSGMMRLANRYDGKTKALEVPWEAFCRLLDTSFPLSEPGDSEISLHTSQQGQHSTPDFQTKGERCKYENWNAEIGLKSISAENSVPFIADSAFLRIPILRSSEVSADSEMTIDKPRPHSSGHIDKDYLSTMNGVNACEDFMLKSPRGSRLFNYIPNFGERFHEKDGRNMAIPTGEREIYRLADLSLGPQETRLHTFTIPSEGLRFAVELKVTVEFTGYMDARSFRQGRLSASLRCTPDAVGNNLNASMRSLGYAPHGLQRPNEGDTFQQTPGIIFIQHRPHYVPLAYKSYDLLVTAFSATRYKVTVIAEEYQSRDIFIAERIKEVKDIRMQVKRLNFNLHDLWESLRLRERHDRVCRKVIKEAEIEYNLCECKLMKLLKNLAFTTSKKCGDHARKSMTFGQNEGLSSTAPASRHQKAQTSFVREQSEAIWKSIVAHELEGIQWGRLLVLRYLEHEELKRAIAGLMKLQRQFGSEKDALCEKECKIITDVQLVVGLIEDQVPATEVTESHEKCQTVIWDNPRSRAADTLMEKGQPQVKGRRKERRQLTGMQMASSLPLDIDHRLRALQRELDQVSSSSSQTIISCALHTTPQQYPTDTLRVELERELERLLRDQLLEQEKDQGYLTHQDMSTQAEETDLMDEKTMCRRVRARKCQEKNGDVKVFALRKHVLLRAQMTPVQREHGRSLASLGPGGCSACMSNPCNYNPILDPEETKLRMEIVENELRYAMKQNNLTIESCVLWSGRPGNNTAFDRNKLVEDLHSEERRLKHMLKLHLVDEEFHRVNKINDNYTQCITLHGYPTLLWIQDARLALGREHSRLVARLVAIQIMDDILDWMLEGWYFGEARCPAANSQTCKNQMDEEPREDLFKTQGHQKKEVWAYTLPPQNVGSAWRFSERVLKDGDMNFSRISSTQHTLKFGLLCITIMYFRAKHLLSSRKQNSKTFQLRLNDGSFSQLHPRVSRGSRTKNVQAGARRIEARMEKELAQVLLSHGDGGSIMVRTRELSAIQLIQRVYRGYVGRIVTRQWRLKRSECTATNFLMISAANTLTRVRKGQLERDRAIVIRGGISNWLVQYFSSQSWKLKADTFNETVPKP